MEFAWKHSIETQWKVRTGTMEITGGLLEVVGNVYIPDLSLLRSDPNYLSAQAKFDIVDLPRPQMPPPALTQ